MRRAYPSALGALIVNGLGSGLFDSPDQALARTGRVPRSQEAQQAALAKAEAKRQRRAERLVRDPGLQR